jgi:type II restriction/modification system DNA methylase subunit YeeA
MDKNAIKKYAVWARKELISRVAQKAQQYGITETEMVDAGADSVNGKVMSAEEMQQRRALIAQINEKGYQQVMEEVAYTWFNRFSALRFMEVNGYLPSHVRVFTDENNAFKPQILAEALHLELDKLDKDKVYALKETEQTEELYKYLLIVQCNALNSILPGMFQTIADYTELLLPDNLLREGSVIEQMISQIPEDNWQDAVQIIGWLYQYYNSEKKDDVFAALKKNVKITKENIPAATQLFTPDWIVRYMVENSLGRLWVEGHPDTKTQLLPTPEEQTAYTAGSRDPEDTKWHYYLEEAQQEPQVQAQLAEIRKQYAALTPEQIKVIDPCCGSGHILAYLFDVLMQIYENYGYTSRDAVTSILQNNLYGLDIDDRAAQLAYFAVMMKARRYDRRFFSHTTQPHVYAIEESNRIEKPDVEYFCNGKPSLTDAMHTILTQLYDAKEYGSILTITPQDWDALYARFDEVADESSFHRESIRKKLLPLVRVAQTLAQKYDVVVTNPPYMGASNMNPKLNEFIKQNYTDYKSDFFSAFIVKCSNMAKPEGYCGFFTPYVWMFIQSYEKLRQYLYQQATLETLIQFEYSAFEEATVPVCTFTFSNRYVNKKGCYLRLVDFRGGMEVQRQKTLEAMTNHDCGFYYEQSTDNFAKIPGSPVAYWWNDFSIFNLDKIEKYYESAGRNKTHNNELYVRSWWEVDDTNRWQPYANGGAFRRWAGNDYDVVDWSETAKESYASHGGLYNQKYAGKRGVCWNLITSYKNGFRLKHENHHYSSGAPTIIAKGKNYDYLILAFLNSVVATELISMMNPTLNTTVNDVLGLPLSFDKQDVIEPLSEISVKESQNDWDSFETSWDFTRHPFIKAITKYPNRMDVGNIYLAECYDIWAGECEERFEKLKANEEELNRIFIDIYGLQDELTPEVEDKDVTVRKADLGRDVRSFISYAVGCMFGRYSPTYDGLAYAGGTWDDGKYNIYKPDADGIIPICDDEYFEDDMVGRFVEFVRAVYGDSSLEDNLRFIANALGGKGQPKEVIRNYFLNDFYADHCKIYQKRPIYWLFDSGKKNGFKCLIYMHRYQPDTIARIRTDYVHEQQARYRTAIEGLEKQVAAATSTSERVKLTKQLNKVQAQDAELHQYEEKVHALADQMIKIDLDDGVKHNYEIFKDVLAKIK